MGIVLWFGDGLLLCRRVGLEGVNENPNLR